MRSLAACAVALAVLAGCASDQTEAGEPSASQSPESAESAESSAGTPTYVALGDSYTAAPGVGETVDEGCARSSSNYPALVADELGLALTDVSCGGATTTSLVGAQETSAGVVPPQFAALTEDTDVVTLGIGGNDQGLFAELLMTCVFLRSQDPEGAPCRDAFNTEGTDRALETIEVVRGRVTSALVGIRDRAPEAEVVLVGYPQLVPARGQCDLLPLTPADYDYVRGLIEALGAATESAAAQAGVRYVDMLAASEGHDICAGEDAWVNGVGGSTDEATGMHPFAAEQEAVAALVVEALEG
ncbi:SGNH/GDSL hydrolase family protein [Nocardioides sp.]|uniref:SGNH/GDSL hydrolase family protein n=1 Tax=Nocardioides sp. TaxID=35761 RepID=UPI001A1CA63B|nr:SGNH/GDSL hydrolase family protein [Nocardioides sp.]MBJ7358548.1 SGNH/GDSL hydrolase family protein [Nocardioides sp.]